MDFDCTKRFRSDLSLLTKKASHGYSNASDDIWTSFKDLDFESVYKKHTCLRLIGKSRLIKSRIPNSASSQGSSNGFRIVFIANPNSEKITFCHIYPKRGKFSKVNMDPKEIADIISELVDETKNNTLTPFSLKETKTTAPKRQVKVS